MNSMQRWLFALVFVALAGLYAALLNLGAFAAKGPRYTADDGARERQERVTSDLALAARIDLVHNLLTERCDDGL